VIFDEVALNNFGVYAGPHSVWLSPPSHNKPVVLIGGLNGGGKSTLLDAIQLALYGRRARCSNRGNLAYDEYLRRSIHRKASPEKGASVELQFRIRSEGAEHTYRIRRTWALSAADLNERVEVIRDGEPNRVLTEIWPELVEEFIPVGISHLFLFDGEKIEGFADLENSTQLLSKAVHSLLGLDLVDKLSTDLAVLQGRKRMALKGDAERHQAERAEAEISALEQLREDLVQQRAAKQNDLDRQQKRLREVEARFQDEGGLLFENRKKLTDERDSVQSKLHRVESELRELASGIAPLLLVRNLLPAIYQQARDEESANQAKVVNRILIERDARMLEEARTSSTPKAVLMALKKFITEDQKQRAKTADTPCYLNLTDEARNSLRGVVETEALGEAGEEVYRLLRLNDELQTRLEELERQLAGVPDEAALAPLVGERQSAQEAVNEMRVALAAIDLEIARVIRDRDRKKAEWLSQAEKTLQKRLETDDLNRMLTHTQRVQQTLDKFRVAVLERHVNRVSQLILDSFCQLLRKQSLVSNLKINPSDFSIELTGDGGKPLSPDRLSAGERQLLAVSMLWGLARAAGRPLPAVIDTPLGRLDASHRINLIEKYFPYASHQVILLSTDEEIDQKYYDKLKPWVGHAYRLAFDDAAGATHVENGYFW
jgi:DNA sulfur modification protein DndD